MDLGALSVLSKVHHFLQTVGLPPPPPTQLQPVTLPQLLTVTLLLPSTQPLPRVTQNQVTQSQVMANNLKNPITVHSRSTISQQILTNGKNETVSDIS